MQTIEAGDTVLTETSTVRMRADVLQSLAQQSKIGNPHAERPEPDNGTRQVWRTRVGAWLRQRFTLAEKPCIDRALNRKGKRAFSNCLEDHQRKLSRAREAGERSLKAALADARESHAATAQHCDTSHAFVLQRLVSDAQGLGQIVNRKLREGRLSHTESTLVDDEYFVPDDFMKWIEFQ